METMFFVLIGVALFALVVWNILLSCSLKDVEERLRLVYGSQDSFNEANRDRFRTVIEAHNELRRYFGMVLEYLGIEIVNTQAKDEVVEIEKIKKEKSK